ncbi:CAMK family protein kinase [Tritrichomonas foetus]|uniref:non-specific serine/threonine protein kinase n=1 Tax=Tritrichomonas foetus TaxID=1144522 RepID=A0A1J4K515_9EUKA|nr:CAMK family protein kinase [Tritrichomonas foetus]|eukprot:OHT06291.1 CAMK family protein kinase [Tritrichomonas foetus]
MCFNLFCRLESLKKWDGEKISFMFSTNIQGYLPFDDPSIRNLLAKVKRGHFTMPEFHPNIKDLISKMMTVDPAQRITMEGIKNHPAFRFGLPTTYIVPIPIPFPDFSNPIDPSIISVDVKNSLLKIGISEEEIQYGLMSTESNPVKVFVMLLTRQIQLNELPWESSITSIESSQNIPIESIPGHTFGNGVVNQSNLYERKKPIPDVSSPDGFSLAMRVNWFQLDTQYVEYDVDETFGPVVIPLVQLMNALEHIVIQLKYSFFHPNDLQILGRNERDTYLIIDVTFTTAEALSIHLQMKNAAQEDRETLCRAISELTAAVL